MLSSLRTPSGLRSRFIIERNLVEKGLGRFASFREVSREFHGSPLDAHYNEQIV